MVGVVNLSQVFRGSFNNAYLGFYGFAPFAGRGYMTEAVGLVLRHAFRSMGLHRVEANLQPANERSRALLERLGFRLEGLLRATSRSPDAGGITNGGRSSRRSGARPGPSRIAQRHFEGPHRGMGKRVDQASYEPGLDLRPARSDDVAAVLALWLAAELFPSATDDAVSVRRLIAHDAAALLVADLEGEVIGSVCATWDGWRGNLYRLAVHPDHRRKGIALRLVARAEQRIADLGGRRIGSIVVDEDEHAVAFWRAAGYERDHRVSRFVKTR
jgi:RimJ/RimL family protein N-acetyltransferase